MQKTHASYVFGIAVSLSAAACGTYADESIESFGGTQEQSIIGGTPSKKGEYPSAGVLLANGGSRNYPRYHMYCSGTLIAPDVVLTAGHCVSRGENWFSFSYDVTDLERRPRKLPEQSVEVKKMLRHPDFDIPDEDGLGQANDVGLAFLREPVTDVEPVSVLRPDEADVLQVGASTMIVGYGMLTPPEVNRWKHDVGIKRQAKSVINEINDYELQVGEHMPTPQKCYGDSGGPSYVNTPDGLRLIGITSRAYDSGGCTKGGVDSRADAFRAWMSDALDQACRDGERSSGDEFGHCPGLRD